MLACASGVVYGILRASPGDVLACEPRQELVDGGVEADLLRLVDLRRVAPKPARRYR